MIGRSARLQSNFSHRYLPRPMTRLSDLAERIDRLVLRHEELSRTNALLNQQVLALQAERDSLKSRLAAARSRVEALLDRLPAEPPAASGTDE
jgi:cell division protein ZapB